MKQTRQTATRERFPTAVRQKTAVVQTMLPAKAGGLSLYLEQNQQRHMFDPFLFTLGINELPYVQSRV